MMNDARGRFERWPGGTSPRLAERMQLNGISEPYIYSSHSDVGGLLAGRARLTPGREALLEIDSGRWFTFEELDERANRLARLMRDEFGVERGARVAVLAHNGVVYLDLLFGLARLGAVFCPLNWRLTAGELLYIVQHAEPVVLVAGPEFGETARELASVVAGLRVFELGDASAGERAQYEQQLALHRTEPPDAGPVPPEHPCCILYTSGTTGKPKGAVIPHRQVVWNAINTVISWGLREDDISPVFTPMFHVGGLFAFLTPLLYVGGRVVLARGFDADESLRTIVAERCTVILGVPTLFGMWQRSPVFGCADLSHVRFFISGGAPCPPQLIEQWRREKGVVFRQGYGLTEAGPNCFSMTDAESARKTGSVGRPVLHSEATIVDPATEAAVPAGTEGELVLRGPHVCSGYWRDAEATAAAIRDGGFHTGDTARQDVDGFFYIVGRIKDMIKSGGENIYAAEVEAVFREHPAVHDAALIGEPDERWGEVGVMFVAAREPVQAEELLAFCAARIAKYKVPKRVVFRGALPYTPYGKVLKMVLRDEVAAQAATAT